MSTVFPAPPGPRKVAGGRGSEWIGEGFELFRKATGTWIGMLLIWLLISAAISAVPGLNVVGSFLNPIFSAGVLLGCASLARGEGLRVEHLFAGFRTGRVGPLLMVTVWTIVFGIAAVVAVAVLVGVSSFDVLKALPSHPSFEDVVGAFGLQRLALLVLGVIAAGLLIAMATWFAVPLIVFRGVSALDAMKLSFRACLTNWWPLTIYGLLLAVIFVLACIPLLLGLLIAFPVAVASVYTSYRDIFPDTAA